MSRRSQTNVHARATPLHPAVPGSVTDKKTRPALTEATSELQSSTKELALALGRLIDRLAPLLPSEKDDEADVKAAGARYGIPAADEISDETTVIRNLTLRVNWVTGDLGI